MEGIEIYPFNRKYLSSALGVRQFALVQKSDESGEFYMNTVNNVHFFIENSVRRDDGLMVKQIVFEDDGTITARKDLLTSL